MYENSVTFFVSKFHQSLKHLKQGGRTNFLALPRFLLLSSQSVLIFAQSKCLLLNALKPYQNISKKKFEIKFLKYYYYFILNIYGGGGRIFPAGPGKITLSQLSKTQLRKQSGIILIASFLMRHQEFVKFENIYLKNHQPDQTITWVKYYRPNSTNLLEYPKWLNICILTIFHPIVQLYG